MGQQVLAHVGNFFQLVETQKSAGALNRVDGPEYARERVFVLRIFLEANQVAVQPVEIFITLDQKIFDDVTLVHRYRSLRDLRSALVSGSSASAARFVSAPDAGF
jgi:hypothetical protein